MRRSQITTIAKLGLTEAKINEIAAVYKSKACNIAATCEAINYSRTQWYEWLKTSPEFKAKIDETDEMMIDYAENKLYKNLQDGKENSLMFYLKNKRPEKWRERKDGEVTGVINLIVLDDD